VCYVCYVWYVCYAYMVYTAIWIDFHDGYSKHKWLLVERDCLPSIRMQVYTCTSMQVCKYASMQVCKYASMWCRHRQIDVCEKYKYRTIENVFAYACRRMHIIASTVNELVFTPTEHCHLLDLSVY